MNIFWFLSSSMTVNWISLGCGQIKTFEDLFWGFGKLINIFHSFLTLCKVGFANFVHFPQPTVEHLYSVNHEWLKRYKTKYFSQFTFYFNNFSGTLVTENFNLWSTKNLNWFISHNINIDHHTVYRCCGSQRKVSIVLQLN